MPVALIFDRETGRVVDIDPRFPPRDEGPRPGRPKLGVVPREVTLLPRHWDWLATQPGGASVALRKLVEAASRDPKARGSARGAMPPIAWRPPWSAMRRAMRKPCGRFMPAQREDFAAHIEAWPPDVRRVLEEMTAEAF